MSSTTLSTWFSCTVSALTLGLVFVFYEVYVSIFVNYVIQNQNSMIPLRGIFLENYSTLVSLLKGSVHHGFFVQNSTTLA